MLAGHILLKILIAFIYQILAFLTKKMAGFSIIIIIPFSLVFCVGCLELVIAFLQAYVFFILLNIYLNDVINLH
jgi:F-type H+-transporting ATPase subunit a